MARSLVQLWRVAIADAPLPTATKAVGWALSVLMTADGCAECSRAAIGARAGTSLRTTERAVSRLEGCGLLLVDRTDGGRAFVNRYQAVVPAVNGVTVTLFSPPKRRHCDAVSRTTTASETTVNGVTGSPGTRKTLEEPRTRARPRTPTGGDGDGQVRDEGAGFDVAAAARAARQRLEGTP